jgi:hypothetical protein
MANVIVEPQPILLNDIEVTLQIDGSDDVLDYSAAVSSAQYTPSSSQVNWKGMKPGSQFSFATTPTWVLALALADDLATTQSLTNTLLANQGKTGHIVFRPIAGGPGWESDVNLTPAGLGGAVDTVSASTVSLGVQGAPAPIAAA